MGHRCEAIIEPYLVVGFDPLLIVGSVYRITGFSLIKKTYSYPPSENRFMVMFHSRTSVVAAVGDGFSKCLYDITELSVIKQSDYHVESVMFDVFGGVVDYHELPRATDGSGRMVILLEDNIEIRVVLKDPYYQDFKCCIDKSWRRRGSFYVVLQLFRAVMSNGEVVLTSYKNVSKMITDQNARGIVYFMSRLTRLIRCAPIVGSRLKLYSKRIIKEELQAPGVHFLTISELKGTSLCGSIWVIGWIHDVFRFPDWYNTRCFRCNTGVHVDSSMVRCQSCKHSIVDNAVYKLRVSVVDGFDIAEFMLLEDTAYEIIGRRAREVLQDVIQDVAVNGSVGIDYLECGHLYFPEIIHKIIGRDKLFFRVKKQVDHLPIGTESLYVVDRICKAFKIPPVSEASSSIVPEFSSTTTDF